MDERDRASAERVRAAIESGGCDPITFRAALTRVPPAERDTWADLVLGLGELPDDGPELPAGCVPYLPASICALLRVTEHAAVRETDVFVDVGSGLGRAGIVVHLLTGASVVGIEAQPHLVEAARELTARLRLDRVSCVQGDAATLASAVALGSVFFLYCPFGGERLATLLTGLEHVARTRQLRVCCLDLPLPPRPWLTLTPPFAADLAIYRSTLFDGAPVRLDRRSTARSTAR